MAGIKTIEQRQYQRKIFTVSELNSRCRQTLEGQFATVWLEAEISNLAMPASGHWYFSLKDARAQVRCAMFKGKNRSCKTPPEDGMKVLVRAKVSLFEPRGEFQLIVEYLELAGTGKLLQEYEELKNRLEKEGLFNPEFKQPINHHYQRIGVITSATGAAIHDVISVIKRRFPLLELVIYPCMVQGEQAAGYIRKQLAIANQRREVDLLLLVRGGGSLEDLWCFNDEELARAIFQSELPVVTGIGHEVDFTIADFVADLRAPTPSAAAERTTADQRELLSQISAIKSWLITFIMQLIQQNGQKVDWLIRQLQSPEPIISNRQQQLQLLRLRLNGCLNDSFNSFEKRLQQCRLKLRSLDPGKKIDQAKQRHYQLRQRLIQSIDKNIQNNYALFREISIKLNSISPLATIGRGYSLTRTVDGKLLKDTTAIKVGDTIVSTLKSGTIESQVTKLMDVDGITRHSDGES